MVQSAMGPSDSEGIPEEYRICVRVLSQAKLQMARLVVRGVRVGDAHANLGGRREVELAPPKPELGASTFLGAPGIATRSKDVSRGSSKDATRGSWHRY